MLRILAPSLLCAVLLIGCSVAPSPSSSLSGPSDSTVGSIGPSSSPSSSSPTGVATASLPPLPPSASLPVPRVAREIGLSILMAPGPSGTVFVSIPKQDGSVLVLLDRSGQPRPGWPITVEKSTACGLLLPADDGSVRVQCDGTDIPQPENDSGDGRAFAFSGDGRQLAGWPVQLRPGHAGSVVGDSLTVLAERYLTDLVTTGEVSHVAWVTAIAANGSLRNGTEVPLVEACCGEAWALGPGWVAYGVLPVGDGSSEPTEMSQITALDLSGVRAGWPVQFEGVGSATAFLPGERIVMTVGSAVQETSRVVAFDSDGGSGADVSAELPIATADWGVLCGAGSPMAPIIGPDGTVFVFSEIDTAIYALDPSLEVLRGWPYRPASRLVQRTTSVQQPGTVDVDCGRIGVPAGAPDGTLYLPLEPRDSNTGGSIVAVGPDGQVRPGWPVELRRAGSEFWSVLIGSDGTVYALAVEPEPGGSSSASILAFAPDSTLVYNTTIVDP